MNRDTLQVPARYYARLTDALVILDIEIEPLLRDIGLSLEQVLSPKAMITVQQIENLVSALQQQTERDDLAILFGRSLHLSSHAVVGYGLLSSPTIGYALELTSKFFALIHPAYRLEYSLDDQYAKMKFTQLVEMSAPCRKLHLESIAVAAFTELTELNGGPIGDCVIQIATDGTDALQSYRDLGIQNIEFNPAFDADLTLLLPPALMEVSPAMADPSSLALAETRCNAMLREVIDDANLTAWARQMMEAANGHLPSLSELAHTANLSPRTLERHLKIEGSSYRKLSSEVLHQKAKSLLKDNRLSITQIAFQLGYSDSANFTRAFKKVEGMSPSGYRDSTSSNT